jgi:Putative peptidoglycan binding domain
MAGVDELISMAVSQTGKSYSNDPKARLDDPDPESFDCSLFVQWVTARIDLVPPLPRVTWDQLLHCMDHGTVIPLSEAEHVRGALLFKNRDSATGQPVDPVRGRAYNGHVAISLGDGQGTVEAMGTGTPVGHQTLTERSFTHGARIPGLTYDAAPPPPPAPVAAPVATAAVGGPTADQSTWLVAGTMSGDVQLLQQRLKIVAARILAAADPLSDFPDTGDFGPMTDIGVRLFQRYVKLHVDPTMDIDGKVGPATWRALDDLVNRG